MSGMQKNEANKTSDNSEESSDEKEANDGAPNPLTKQSSVKKPAHLHLKLDGKKLDISSDDAEIDSVMSPATPPLKTSTSSANIATTQSSTSTANVPFSPWSMLATPLALIFPYAKDDKHHERSRPINVHVKSQMRVEVLTVQMLADSTVLDLKYSIDATSDQPLPPKIQMLSFKGKALSDDEATLASEGVVDGSTINLCTKMNSGPHFTPPGGGPSSAMFILMPKCNKFDKPVSEKKWSVPIKVLSKEQLAAEKVQAQRSHDKLNEIRTKRFKRSKTMPNIFTSTASLKSKPSKENSQLSSACSKESISASSSDKIELASTRKTSSTESVQTAKSLTAHTDFYNSELNDEDCCAVIGCDRHLKTTDLVRGKCRCSASFCHEHIPANMHHCMYDYKKHGRRELADKDKKPNKSAH